MKKTRKLFVILFSTLITLSMIYGISSGKILTEALADASVSIESAADTEQSDAVTLLSKALPATGEAVEVTAKVLETEKEPSIITYSVKSGDTLDSIAKEHNVSVNTIADSSGISLSSVLKIGQELRFPSVNGILHTVKKGDSPWEISKKYRVSLDDVLGANNLNVDDKISIGQQLIIPNAQDAALYAASSLPSRGSVKASTVTSSSWPTIGTISSNFGKRWGRMHTGIDIAAPTGTDVHAYAAGKVTFSGWNGSYGKLVIVDHGNGMETYYAHNSKLLVSVGDSVEKGEHIAEVGSTGNSTGPHCHFEVRKNGTPVNPLSYLQ